MVKLHDDILICAQGNGFISVEALTGIYQAFEEYDLVPGFAQASSGSAIFTSLYYSGHDSCWFRELMDNTSLKDWIVLDPIESMKSIAGCGNYFLDSKKIHKLLQDEMTIEATHRVKVSVTDAKTGRGMKLPATPATVGMASAFPIALIPVKAHGIVGKDGGIVNNIPLPKVRDVANYRYVFLFTGEPWKPTDSNFNLVQAVDLIGQLRTQEMNQIIEAGYFDEPNFIHFELASELSAGLFNWSKNYELREAAYQLAKQIIIDKNLTGEC